MWSAFSLLSFAFYFATKEVNETASVRHSDTRGMVQLEELDGDEAPPLDQTPSTEFSGRVNGIEGCENLHVASELAFEDGTASSLKYTHVLSFGDFDDKVDAPTTIRHVYRRAENGALITHLREACEFIGKSLKSGGQIFVVSSEEGEAGAGLVVASFLILEKNMECENAVDAVVKARPMNGLKDHPEFMKNLRFLCRNGIPDWA